MRQLFLWYPNKTQRLLEIAIPLTSWVIITMPLWLSFWHPALVAYLIITFDVYWFYKSVTLVFFALRSFVTFTAHVAVNWLELAQTLPHANDLWHIVIVPEFAEPVHILRRTIENLAHQDFPRERMIVVLATETKDPNAVATASLLKEEFGNMFGHFLVTQHTLQPGEVAGKSSNMAWAARQAELYIKRHHIPIEWTTITSCDADALPHPKYFSALSFQFLSDRHRYDHLYQGSIMFYNNIWRIPLPNRFLNTLNSMWNLAFLSQETRLINFSTYSLSFQTAREVGYWAVDVIPEDYHMFFSVFFARGEGVSVRPIFLPVLVDAAESHGFFHTFINQYEQAKRWAWGVSDIPYVIRQTFLHPEIKLSARLQRVGSLLEHHILWPTNWFILTIGSTVPPLINPLFGRTVLGHNLARISSGILTLSTIFLIIVFIIDWRIKPPPPQHYPKWKLPLLYLQWLTLPFISFFLSALPGLDAHTRLMLGKRLEYRVTEKI
jgi:cellulose synthase/poly-beta-1,6-N-acetylglucosamine synthase-like glycosyltransferase